MRVKANYTFEKAIKDKFDSICSKKCINKSALLEKYIEKFIEENREDS